MSCELYLHTLPQCCLSMSTLLFRHMHSICVCLCALLLWTDRTIYFTRSPPAPHESVLWHTHTLFSCVVVCASWLCVLSLCVVLCVCIQRRDRGRERERKSTTKKKKKKTKVEEEDRGDTNKKKIALYVFRVSVNHIFIDLHWMYMKSSCQFCCCPPKALLRLFFCSSGLGRFLVWSLHRLGENTHTHTLRHSNRSCNHG